MQLHGNLFQILHNFTCLTVLLAPKNKKSLQFNQSLLMYIIKFFYFITSFNFSQIERYPKSFEKRHNIAKTEITGTEPPKRGFCLHKIS